MCDCGSSVSQVISSDISTLELIFNIIIFGLTSSFTHCIGMCSGIAIGQSATRMIERNVSFLQKVLSCISWEYYIGKAMTYTLLTLFIMKIGTFFESNSIFEVVRFTLLLVVVIYLIFSGIKVIYKISGIFLPEIVLFKSFYQNFNFSFVLFNNKILSRIVIGMCLGLIPCGLVYSAIGIIVGGTKSTITAGFIAFLFGLTTFPGLFIVSYAGSIFFYRYQRLLSFLYLFTVAWNIKFLISMM